MRRLVLATLAVVALVAAPAWGEPARPEQGQAALQKDAEMVGKLGGVAERHTHFDICLPADLAEARALGNNAIVLVSASSRAAGELPLTSAYVRAGGRDVALQRIAIFPPRTDKVRTGDSETDFVTQDAFYLVPLALLKHEGSLLVDFTGERKAFNVTVFPIRMRDFLAKDADDRPSAPDKKALAEVLLREYPDWFNRPQP